MRSLSRNLDKTDTTFFFGAHKVLLAHSFGCLFFFFQTPFNTMLVSKIEWLLLLQATLPTYQSVVSASAIRIPSERKITVAKLAERSDATLDNVSCFQGNAQLPGKNSGSAPAGPCAEPAQQQELSPPSIAVAARAASILKRAPRFPDGILSNPSSEEESPAEPIFARQLPPAPPDVSQAAITTFSVSTSEVAGDNPTPTTVLIQSVKVPTQAGTTGVSKPSLSCPSVINSEH